MSRRKGNAGILRELRITNLGDGIWQSWPKNNCSRASASAPANVPSALAIFRGGEPCSVSETRLRAAEAFCNTGGNRHFKFFMLVGLHHEQNPEYEGDKPDQAKKRRRHSERAETSPEHHPCAKNNPQHNVQDVEAAERDDRLSRVESDEGTLVDQIKNDSRDPTQQVTQGSGDIFGQARLRSLHRRDDRVARLCHAGTLRSAALRAKGSTRSDFR